MRLFGKKKVEEVQEVKEVQEVVVTALLESIDKSVNEMAAQIVKNNDKTIQMIHMSGTSDTEGNHGKGKTLAVIGNPDGLVEMLHAAGLKANSFAKILISVAEMLVSSEQEYAEFQAEIKEITSEDCDCPACQASDSKKGLNVDDIRKMSENDMNDLVKKIIRDSKRP